MKILAIAALLVVPALVDLVLVAWLAEFRIDSAAREDGGMGTYVAAVRARNRLSNYDAEGRRRLPILWAAGVLRLACFVIAGVLWLR
jgi:hypothetical protein